MAHERPSSSPSASLTAEENNLFLDILHEAPLSGHRQPRGIFGSVLYCVLLAGYAVVAAAAPWIFLLVPKLLPTLLCSCNVLLLIITGFAYFNSIGFTRLEKCACSLATNSTWLQVRTEPSQGLLLFQPKTEAYFSTSICYHYLWSVIWLLIFCCLWCRKCTDAACISLATVYTHIIYINIVEKKRIYEYVVGICFSPCNQHDSAYWIIMIVEVICAGCFMSVYIGKVQLLNNFIFTSAHMALHSGCESILSLIIKFFKQFSFKFYKIMVSAGCIHQYNSLNGQPDILKSLYSALQPSSSLEDLRYYDGGRLSDQQMALLQYQRENLHYLSEEVLRLQECLSKYQRSDDGSTPQVDLAHLLASRDQELRALTAEMNQVHSELRLARSLIAERDSEVQHMRATNNQYVEENERLRAILGEWSARAAKLERALEAERMSNVELQKSIAKLRSKPPNQLADEHLE
ncbi:hypothetical protein MUK42_34368 [Musa troglodytarum]|uniref:Uncharacterized protein n=2 Tax=Magnoliopsida TaxID=3398 RepID=A0A9E7H6A3_9LILI|nr:hypothetical protein MUK42_34368 [Musa troglodytarum]